MKRRQTGNKSALLLSLFAIACVVANDVNRNLKLHLKLVKFNLYSLWYVGCQATLTASRVGPSSSREKREKEEYVYA